MPKGHVFNRRKTRLLRGRISTAENLVSLVLGCALLGMVIWVAGRRDAFDPGDRDLAPELLARSGPEIEIYRPPMRPWVEPGHYAPSTGPDLGLFPVGVAHESWQPAGRVRTFDAGNLYEKINGEAEKFIKQGFKTMHYLVLRDTTGGGELAIELYDQGDIGGSLGIFGEHVAADQSRETVSGVTFHLTAAGVIGRIDRYFFRAAGDRVGPAVTVASRRLATALAALVETGPPAQERPRAQAAPQGLALLTGGLGLAESAVSFQAGNVFQYDFAQSFWFGALDGGGRVFLHFGRSDAEAAALVDQLREEQAYEYRALASEAAWDLYEHAYLKTYFALARRGRQVFGVDNLKQIGEVAPLMRKLAEVLPDE